MMKENLHFCVLETDFKKFAFTTVKATTEVLLIKQKKGASYNQTHDLLEDQVQEQLLVEYVTSLNEVWFEPKHETFDRQLLKRFK